MPLVIKASRERARAYLLHVVYKKRVGGRRKRGRCRANEQERMSARGERKRKRKRKRKNRERAGDWGSGGRAERKTDEGEEIASGACHPGGDEVRKRTLGAGCRLESVCLHYPKT